MKLKTTISRIKLAKNGRSKKRFSTEPKTARAAKPASTKLVAQHLALADQHVLAGDLTAARESLQRALKLAPRKIAAIVALGNVLMQLGETGAARLEYLKATTLDPNNASAHVRLGLTELQLNHVEAFENAMGRALELDPLNHDALKVLADLNLRNGDLVEAAKTCEKLLGVAPNDIEALWLSAQCALKQENRAAAETTLLKLRQLAPNHDLTVKLAAEVKSAADREQLVNEMNQIKWWHRIPLGDGIITPGVVKHGEDHEDYATKRFGLPLSFAGKTVLDVGAWDGYFSFEAERRGAEMVLAADIAIQEPGKEIDAHGSVGNWGANKGFRFARQALKSKVNYVNASIYQLDDLLAKTGTFAPRQFDYVFFFGVLYHLKEPLLALEKLAAITKEVALIETASTPGSDCVMRYQPGFDNDPSNVWYPTASCLQAMLCRSGFRSAEVVVDLGERVTVRAFK